MLNLTVAAAQYALGLLPSSALPDIATDALTSELDSPATRVLAGYVETNLSEAGPVFERMLVELEIGLPSAQQAVRFLLNHYIKEVAGRRLPPREGLGKVMELYYLSEHSKERYVGAALGIEHLVGAHWNYDDLEERPSEVSFQGLYGQSAVLAFDEEVIRLSSEGLARHGG